MITPSYTWRTSLHSTVATMVGQSTSGALTTCYSTIGMRQIWLGAVPAVCACININYCQF